MQKKTIPPVIGSELRFQLVFCVCEKKVSLWRAIGGEGVLTEYKRDGKDLQDRYQKGQNLMVTFLKDSIAEYIQRGYCISLLTNKLNHRVFKMAEITKCQPTP